MIDHISLAPMPILVACCWVFVATLAAILPSRDHHWRQAYVLIALGFQILIWLALAQGALAAGLFALAMGSILRWPLIYLVRWLRRILGR